MTGDEARSSSDERFEDEPEEDDRSHATPEDRGLVSESNLSIVESGRVSQTSVDLLGSMSRLLDAIEAQRHQLLAALEERRRAEVENARLESLLVGERELRRRVEDELERLRDELEQRRERAREHLDRIYGSDSRLGRATQLLRQTGAAIDSRHGSSTDLPPRVGDELDVERERRRRGDEQIQQLAVQEKRRRSRALEELEQLRRDGKSEEEVRASRAQLERLLGMSLAQAESHDLSPSRGPASEGADNPNQSRDGHEAAAPPWPGGPREGNRSRRVSQEDQGANVQSPGNGGDVEASLPPGWRYAREELSEGRRRWWSGLRRPSD
jgi:hypothetical protein